MSFDFRKIANVGTRNQIVARLGVQTAELIQFLVRPEAEREAIKAVDEAAEALGNTRSVARAHYVHPDLLEIYTEHTFADYLARSKPRRLAGLEPAEQRLAGLLTELFDTEFSLLNTRS